MIPIIPVDFNVTSNTSVCALCSTAYHEINDFFLQITQGNKPGVCMDIVDTVGESFSGRDSLKNSRFLQ